MTSMFLKSALAAALAAGGLFSAAPATADSFADHFLGEPTEGR